MASKPHVTLLERLARSGVTDQAAWAEFVGRYGGRIYRCCREQGLPQADAEAVTRTVLLRLAARMRSFAYDPAAGFRAWLRAVAGDTWKDFVDGGSGRPAGGEPAADAGWQRLQAWQGLTTELEDQFDKELLERAMQAVRLRVAPHVWHAFRLTAVEGVPAAEVARQLEMKIARVYAARSKVQRLLKAECRRLEGVLPA